jgi:hypothetical protein
MGLVGGEPVPVVVLIPEFNLADWRDDVPAPPLLDSAATSRWLDLRIRAQGALRGDDPSSAFKLAEEMISLDGGTTPIGHYLVAEAKRSLGEHLSAKIELRKALDFAICWPAVHTPRCYSAIRDEMLARDGSETLQVVDLASRFDHYLDGALPGKRMFHDYCHLTLEGITISMASAAEALLPHLGRKCCTAEELSTVSLRVDPSTIAIANLMAGIFNSRLGQSAETVRYHLSRASDEWPDVISVLALFADFHLRRTPPILCKSFDDMLSRLDFGYQRLAFYVPDQPRFSEIPVDLKLIQEILNTVSDKGFTCNQIRQILRNWQ